MCRKRDFSPSAPAAVHGGNDEETGLAGTLFGGQTESTGFRLKLG
jgi:hypothetical protein